VYGSEAHYVKEMTGQEVLDSWQEHFEFFSSLLYTEYWEFIL